jgi:hypothetical protein
MPKHRNPPPVHPPHGGCRSPGARVSGQRADTAAGPGCVAAGAVCRARDPARGRAADQRDDGQRADRVPGRQQRRRAEHGGPPGRAGAGPDRRHRAHLFRLAARHGGADGAVSGGCAAHRGAGAPVRRAQRQPGLVAAQPGRAAAGRQAQGHRRRAGAGRHAVEPRHGQRQRTGARGQHPGGRAQAGAGCPRGADHRRAGHGRACLAGPGPHARAWRRPAAPAGHAGCRQHGSARRLGDRSFQRRPAHAEHRDRQPGRVGRRGGGPGGGRQQRAPGLSARGGPVEYGARNPHQYVWFTPGYCRNRHGCSGAGGGSGARRRRCSRP